jgi:hypothetical protein
MSILALAAALAGCEQGVGDFCQVNSDCEPPLQCNASTRMCQRRGTAGTADAAVMPDAAIPPDAAPLPDAAPDASPDAGDAGEVDAGKPDAGDPDAGKPDAAATLGWLF